MTLRIFDKVLSAARTSTIAVIAAAALAANAAAAPAAGGQDCTGLLFANGFDPPSPSTVFATTYDYFYRFDVEHPAAFKVVSSSHITAMKLDHVGNDFTRAYGIDSFGIRYNTFAMIDTITGDVTLIGPSEPWADDDELFGAGQWQGFRYDNTTGTAYASATNCGGGLSHLYTIDMATGAASLVGELPGVSCAGAIAIDAGGDMYGIDYGQNMLVAIDKHTGTTTPIGYAQFEIGYIHDIDFDDATGALYFAGYDSNTYEGELRTFDLATGEATLVGLIGASNFVVGLAIEASACSG